MQAGDQVTVTGRALSWTGRVLAVDDPRPGWVRIDPDPGARRDELETDGGVPDQGVAVPVGRTS